MRRDERAVLIDDEVRIMTMREGLSGALVDAGLELFADLEVDRLLGLDMDRLTRLGVAALVGLVVLERKTAKPSNFT